MAITKIWAVRYHLNRLLSYVSNIEKTDVEMVSEKELQTIQSVIGYAGEDYKTENRMFVTGINVTMESAAKQMMITASNARKQESDIVAWHAVQSFSPGEVTPDQCHKIGVELAKKLWGDRFEVIVTTHLDRNHLHNHFVVNAVSFIDGKRYPASKATYREMQHASDELCREYSISTIRNPKLDRTLSYDQWRRDRDGRDTIRNRIRKDFDEAIQKSFTMDGFFLCLKAKGYRFQTVGKYPRVKAPFSERYLRLYKLGNRYELKDIQERIREPKGRNRSIAEPVREVRRGRIIRVKIRKPVYVLFPGIRAFYYKTLYQVGILPKGCRAGRFRMSRQEREITGKIDRMCEELRVLSKYRICTLEELQNKEKEIMEKKEAPNIAYTDARRLENEWRILRRAARRILDREKEKKEAETTYEYAKGVRTDGN